MQLSQENMSPRIVVLVFSICYSLFSAKCIPICFHFLQQHQRLWKSSSREQLGEKGFMMLLTCLVKASWQITCNTVALCCINMQNLLIQFRIHMNTYCFLGHQRKQTFLVHFSKNKIPQSGEQVFFSILGISQRLSNTSRKKN